MKAALISFLSDAYPHILQIVYYLLIPKRKTRPSSLILGLGALDKTSCKILMDCLCIRQLKRLFQWLVGNTLDSKGEGP